MLRRFIVFTLIAVLLGGIAGGCGAGSGPGAYTDDMGRQISLDKIPQRLVSHVPPITEMLFALGLGDRVVGVSDFDDYPPEAKTKPSVGNYFNPSIEKIVALSPDLVLTDGHSDNIKQLDSLGIKFMVIDPKNIDGVMRDIELLGKVAGVGERAEKLVKSMRSDIARVTGMVENTTAVRAFYLIDATDLNNPWTAGPGSSVDYLIRTAGGINAAGRTASAWAQMSIEEVVSADPEVVLLPASHGSAFTSLDVLEAHPAWRQTSAVKNGRVFVIDGDLVDGYGPRIVQGLEAVARLLHPEVFK